MPALFTTPGRDAWSSPSLRIAMPSSIAATLAIVMFLAVTSPKLKNSVATAQDAAPRATPDEIPRPVFEWRANQRWPAPEAVQAA
ncbi:MAG TPA: hypothetical protein PLV92_20815, partial [Pirellulaceae bacterium]|nr:hypothetical protein [Pirellulaceae bacterium]